jgi:hypothetical protein
MNGAVVHGQMFWGLSYLYGYGLSEMCFGDVSYVTKDV